MNKLALNKGQKLEVLGLYRKFQAFKYQDKPLGYFYALLIVAFTITWVINHFIYPFSYIEWWLLPVFVSVQSIQFLLLIWGVNPRALSNINLLIIILTLESALVIKPDYYHVVVFWSAIVPILVTATTDRTDSYIWYVATALFVLVNGWFINNSIPEYEVSVIPYRFMFSGLVFLGLSSFVAIVYHQNRIRQKRKVDEKNELLQKQARQLAIEHEKLIQTQQKLIQGDKMASIGLLAAGVAHEINNPLNYIQSGLYGLQDELEKAPDDLKEATATYIQYMKEGVKRATEIVKSLGHFSRQTPHLDELCDLHTIIDNCLSILNNKLKYKVDIIKEYSNEEIVLKGNIGKLHQVFLNILGNAEQAIDDTGNIQIITKKDSEGITVAIKDDGIGISENDINHIFDPFFTKKDPGLGVGLGLSITKEIIDEHGGNIQVFSEIGSGSEFVIHF